MQLEGLRLVTVYAPHECIGDAVGFGRCERFLDGAVAYDSLHVYSHFAACGNCESVPVSFILTRLLRNLSEEPSHVEIKEVPPLQCTLFGDSSVAKELLVPQVSESGGVLNEMDTKESVL